MRYLLLLAAAVAFGQPKFTDVTKAAGIQFKHNAAKAGKKWLPETMGAGCGFVDLDGDGFPEIVLVNQKPALYKNNRNGTFTQVPLNVDLGQFAMGVAAGDYDGDGKVDLYFTALDGDHLMHNEGGLKFTDATKAAGIANANFGTSAAFVDYDKDGRVDLVVANYVMWARDKDLFCSLDGVAKSYCTPESYKGVSVRLYRNAGGGKFEDATKKAKLWDPTSKSLGVAVLDFNQDGWPDLFVANDTQPNKLYRNLKNGTFAEDGVAAGVAFGEDGVARGAMGVDAADYDRSGRPHLLVGNFANQMLGLYRNEGNSLFVDEAPRSTVGRSTLLSLTFGVFFFDYDLDGWLDIFTANGHIEEEIHRVQPKVDFAQAPMVFHNVGKGKFEDASKKLGGDLQRPMVARGAAHADFDGDGDLDVLVTTNNGPAYVFRNDANGAKNGWLRVRPVPALGAVVRVESAGGKQWQMVRSGSSYCSAGEQVATFGLGKDAVASVVEVEWPDGKKKRLTGVKANQVLVIEENK